MTKINLPTTEELTKIELDLTLKQSEKRRSAAKKIGKLMLSKLANPLFEAYLNEKRDVRTWETQTEMIKSLGRLRHKELLPIVEQIIAANSEFDMITSEAATAYVRLKRETENNIDIVFELFNKGKYAVLSGALYALQYDNIIPENAAIEKLVSLVNNTYKYNKNGVTDLRQILACAMSGWPKEIVASYLEAYKNQKTISKDVINHALKGKSYCAGEY